jgi:hypothetical protein
MFRPGPADYTLNTTQTLSKLGRKYSIQRERRFKERKEDRSPLYDTSHKTQLLGSPPN